ncbi:MAG: TAXI family TRAP transporter solute-binding subunit [Stackebrandtia sp.]
MKRAEKAASSTTPGAFKTVACLASVSALTFGLAACGDLADKAEGHISWATSDVDSAGHTALVSLATLLNKEWKDHQIDVLPTAGAVQSVIGYSTGEYDGYYGADVAFYEMARDADRFEGFSDQAQRTPVQSFWAYPLETGLAVHADDADSVTGWGDLADRPVFTGPPPWDVRANLERAMDAVDVGHSYVELDTDVVGSSLDGGDVDATIVYTTGEAAVPPWLSEAELQTDMRILNPSDDEVAQLEEAGLDVVEIDASVFETDVGVDTALFTPFYYGFHLGMEVSEADMYELLSIVEANVDTLAESDASYGMLAEDMAELQRRGVESSVDDVEVHPGLAKWMKEHDVWDEAWDDRVADKR